MCKAVKRIEKEIMKLCDLAGKYKREGNLLWYYDIRTDIENLKRVHKMSRDEIFFKILEIANNMFEVGKTNEVVAYSELMGELEALLIGLNCPRKVIDKFHKGERIET